jgi:hypothetical protein
MTDSGLSRFQRTHLALAREAAQVHVASVHGDTLDSDCERCVALAAALGLDIVHRHHTRRVH